MMKDQSSPSDLVISPISPAVQPVNLGAIPKRPDINAAVINAAKAAQESIERRSAMRFSDPDTPSKQREFVDYVRLPLW